MASASSNRVMSARFVQDKLCNLFNKKSLQHYHQSKRNFGATSTIFPFTRINNKNLNTTTFGSFLNSRQVGF